MKVKSIKNKVYLGYRLIAFLLLGSVMFSCQKKEDLSEQVSQMDFMRDHDRIVNDIDQWLYDKFTKDYNIRVQYKFDRSEVAWKALTPPKEERVIPTAQLLLDYFIYLYEAETDEYFIKTYLPKQYMFVGSPEYNPNGTTKTGSALAGQKVTLFRINRYLGDWRVDDKDPDAGKKVGAERILKTIHHEFGHILDQNKRVGPEFEDLSKEHYVDDEWDNYPDEYAWNLGFVTSYAMSNASDDFVETIATMIVYGQEYLEHVIENSTPEGAEVLRQKERLVVDYYKNNWNIDFRSLQNRFAEAAPDPWNPPAGPNLADDLGHDKTFTAFVFDPEAPNMNESSAFTQLWNEFYTEHLGRGRELHSLQFDFQEADEIRMRLYSRKDDGSVSYSSMYFTFTDVGDQTFKLEYTTPASGSVFNYTSQLRDFFESHLFKLKYDPNDPLQGGWYVVGEEDKTWLTGELLN